MTVLTKLIATDRYSFGGRVLEAGDVFEADDYCTRILVSIGRARFEDEPVLTETPMPEKPVEANAARVQHHSADTPKSRRFPRRK
jgi:hypothetical protein